MVSRFVFGIFALSLISFGSGYLVKRESGVSKVMRCISKAFQNSYKEKVKGSGNADSMCNLYKVSSLILKCPKTIFFNTQVIRVTKGERIDVEPPGCGTRNPDNVNKRKVEREKARMLMTYQRD